MLGLPTETDEDVLGIADLAEKVYQAWKETTPNPKRGVTITVSTAWFVPKPHTAFQWEPQISMEEYQRRVKLLREHMRGRSIKYNWHDSQTSFLEAVFARGDRKVAQVMSTPGATVPSSMPGARALTLTAGWRPSRPAVWTLLSTPTAPGTRTSSSLGM